MPPLSEDERYEIGVQLGKVIWRLFEVIAQADGVDVHVSVQEWCVAYLVERIASGPREEL